MDRRNFLRAVGVGGAAASLTVPALGCAPPVAPDPLAGQGGVPTPVAGRDTWATVPAAFNTKVTAEIANAELSVLEGAVPPDMAGHVLFNSLSLLDTDAGFSGDALIWRVDLDGPVPRITSRILRTADYEMSRAFAGTPLAFESRGMLRMSPLGLQNQNNTAIVVMDGNRLLATVDGGRSWEFDPATLSPISPVGRLDDYRPMLEFPDFNRFICPYTITSAHPPYDPETGEYYHVSLSIVPIPGMDYTEVLLWDGQGDLKRVPITLPDGRNMTISQSAHQMAISRDHLVIVDASATIEFPKLLNHPNSQAAGEHWVPRPDTHLYLIDRDELRRTTGSVTARLAVIPRETGHLMVDYDNAPGRIVVHSAHTSAQDFAEWVMPFDRHPDTRESVRPALVNAITPVNYDIGVVGRYEIDTRTGKVLDQQAFFNDWTWGTGGLTARNPNTAVDTLGDLYHVNSGFPTDLAVERVYRGFRDYAHRLVAPEDLPWSGVPTSLVRIDHDAGRVVEGYYFDGDRFAWTPTFVPRHGTASGSDDGYIVTVVFSDHATEESVGTELWIFDAASLAQGPVAKLGRADLEMPLTLHSAWLDSLHMSRPDYRVDVGSELRERAATWRFEPSVLSTVRDVVVPAYERSVV